MRERDEEILPPDDMPGDDRLTGQERLGGERLRDERLRDDVVREPVREREMAGERMDALFADADRGRHQKRWESIQTSFVDDPRRSVQEADSLVSELTQEIQRSFATQRERLEASLSRGGETSTEDLRRTLQQYRAFFTRLLSM
jgi:hypothetical protein